jgi:hypothetical protein
LTNIKVNTNSKCELIKLPIDQCIANPNLNDESLLAALNLHEVFNSVDPKIDNYSEESEQIEIDTEEEDLDFEIVHTHHSDSEHYKEEVKENGGGKLSCYSRSESDLILSTDGN